MEIQKYRNLSGNNHNLLSGNYGITLIPRPYNCSTLPIVQAYQNNNVTMK